MKLRKKLIEVALPLPEINDASAYDKMPGIGPHPKGIHHWWARLPLPTARAVLFASVVDDPESHPDKWPTEEVQNQERERLFDIIRRMMQKKLHEHPEVYDDANREMLKYNDGRLPAVFDPFAGGGTIPLEANRLGFEAHAGDLNPVAVLLNKCNLELTPRWSDHAPVNRLDRTQIAGKEGWRRTNGLAADVRHYGRVIHERAKLAIGRLYPQVALPPEEGGYVAPVVAWLWARTVASPNPAAQGKHVPLMSSFWLSSKQDGPVWLEPIVDRVGGSYRFGIKSGAPSDRAATKAGTKLGRGAKFRCLLTNAPIGEGHLKSEARAGRLGLTLVAVVADGKRGRIYLPASETDVQLAFSASPNDPPSEAIAYDSRYLTPPGYGMDSIDKFFTLRQLAAMETISNEVKAILGAIREDSVAAGMLEADAESYARTVTTFLGLAVDRCADFNNALCRWSPSNEKVMNLFGRQAIPMVWDFAEANLLGGSVGAWLTCSDYVAQCIGTIGSKSCDHASALQIDAASGANLITNLLVSTDPPYYDNVPYADISDFFYVWLRRTIGFLYPDLFKTLLVPKLAELTASPQRFDGDKEKAKNHFESGFGKVFSTLREKMAHEYPLTVYYSFKQADEDSDSDAESDRDQSGVDLTTGWETLLEALISSGFQITATWPVRASQAWRMRSMGSNALASYIVLACRPRESNAPQTDRRSFITELKHDLPTALRHLQQGNIAPVDFAQAAIGPGMAIYSRFSSILETSGNSMTVRAALSLINQTLTEVLSEVEDEFDADTRWAIPWFEQHGFEEGDFGDAELLSKAKVTAVASLQQAHIIYSKAGRVRLLRPDELNSGWEPDSDTRKPVWEALHHLVRALNQGGETAASALVARLGSRADAARELAYRLYILCERKKRAQEALVYNALVQSWPEIQRLARETESRPAQPQQTSMFS